MSKKRYFKLTEITSHEYEKFTGCASTGFWTQSIDPEDGAIYIATNANEESVEIDMDAIEYAFG